MTVHDISLSVFNCLLLNTVYSNAGNVMCVL